MTGTPSKDRAEAHMAAATRTSAKICRMEPCYPDQFEMRDIIAAALATSFAEGMKRGYAAGFKASGEGWNGEYPYGDSFEDPEADSAWISTRDSILAQLTKAE